MVQFNVKHNDKANMLYNYKPTRRLILEKILLGRTREPLTINNLNRFLTVEQKSPEPLLFLKELTDYQNLYYNSFNDSTTNMLRFKVVVKELLPFLDFSRDEDLSRIEVISTNGSDKDNSFRTASTYTKNSSSASTLESVKSKEIFVKLQLEALIQKFFVDGAPYELNLTQSLKNKVLQDLAQSPNPIALVVVEEHILNLITESAISPFLKSMTTNLKHGVFTLSVITACFIVVLLALLALIFTSKIEFEFLFSLVFKFPTLIFLNFGLMGILFAGMGICPILNALQLRMKCLPGEAQQAGQLFYKVEDPIVMNRQRWIVLAILLAFLIISLPINFLLFYLL